MVRCELKRIAMAGWAGWRRDRDNGSRLAARGAPVAKKGTTDKVVRWIDIIIDGFTPFANVVQGVVE